MGDRYDENCTVPAFALNDRGIHGYCNFILLLLDNIKMDLQEVGGVCGDLMEFGSG